MKPETCKHGYRQFIKTQLHMIGFQIIINVPKQDILLKKE